MKTRDDAFQYYFYFLEERMNIFWRRYEGETSQLSKDKIFTTYKFTNVYRALDRVSQYLIKHVIYQDRDYSETDVLLRILLFKVFNNINTWKFLESELEDIRVETFNVDRISILLSERIQHTPIFSAAYMMTGSHEKYKAYASKHEKWMRMIKKEFLGERLFDKILNAKSLEEIYLLLESRSFLGSFLSYQYAIDFNYSSVINFDENSFVKAGIGAIRGIKKCFVDFSKYSNEDCIKYVEENFEELQNKFGYTKFVNLFGRNPTLIDLQNCFCETDKFLRVKMPELQVDNVRIKQKFTSPKEPFSFFFPPKWDLNQKTPQCYQKKSPELTLF